MSNCPKCASVHIPQCLDEVKFSLGLEPNKEYYWFITDKFGNRYYKVITTDLEGSFIINKTDVPDGLFTAYSGVFELVIKENYSGDEVVLSLNDQEFKCLQMTFINETPAEQEGSDDGSPQFFVIGANESA